LDRVIDLSIQQEEAVRQDRDSALRNGEMEVLIAFGDISVPHLTKLLTADNEEVRNFSAVMLGDIGNPQAVMPLIDALQDSEANVRHGAATALGKIGDCRAVLPLQKMDKGDFWDHLYASAALALLAGARKGGAATGEAGCRVLRE
jgi:HEAT repeat protein